MSNFITVIVWGTIALIIYELYQQYQNGSLQAAANSPSVLIGLGQDLQNQANELANLNFASSETGLTIDQVAQHDPTYNPSNPFGTTSSSAQAQGWSY